MSNFVFMNRSRILATTARRQTIGAMNAVKPLSNWSAIAASGASGNGGNVNGASTSAANTVAMSMAAATIMTGIATETATDALHSFVVGNENGAFGLSRGAPFSFCDGEEN